MFQTPNTQNTTTSESESQEFTVPSIPTRNKRKIKDPLLQAVDALQKVSTQHFSNVTNDEFDLFGQTIAQQLRQLPLEIALETEEMILSTVRKQRIKLAKQRTSTQQVRLPATSSELDTLTSTSGVTDNEYTYDEDYDVLARAIASIHDTSMPQSELSYDQY